MDNIALGAALGIVKGLPDKDISRAEEAAVAAEAAADAAVAAAQSLTVDSAMSSSSTNPVQNKVIYDEIASLKEGLSEKADKSDAFGSYVVNTASGSIASFPDGADGVPVKSLVVDIQPYQKGTGDPSPENVRPISGWTGVELWRTNDNLYTTETFERDSASSMHRLYVVGRYMKAGTYYFYFTQKNDPTATYTVGLYLGIDNGDASRVGSNYNSGDVKAFTLERDCYATIYISGSTLPFSTTFVTTLTRFNNGAQHIVANGEIFNIDWTTEAGTVYGGTLDVTSGVLTVDSASVDMGTLTWNLHSTPFFYASISGMKSGTLKTLCSIFPGGYTANTPYFTVNGGTVRVYNSEYESVEDFASAVDGEQFVYELATPQTYQLTPTEVKTLLGQNNIWSDTGNSTVTYCADPKKYVDSKVNTAQVLMELLITANRENSMTASKAYSANELVIINGTLYKVASSIANGGTFTPGTNVIATTVAVELAALA